MKKRITMLVMLLAALLLSGCGLRTVEEMYALPKRSEEYMHLQKAFDSAMAGLEYSAPVAGENQQTVQMADLDGDGVEEYLVFAKGNTEKPLQILIFCQTPDGGCQIMSVIESRGSAFDRVEYVEIDHKPGCEIVVGRKVSDQLMTSVGVYSFRDGFAQQIMTEGCSRFMTYDLDGDDKNELILIQPGESESDRAVAVMYNYRGGTMERSVEAGLSRRSQDIRRITGSYLEDGVPAVYVTSAVDDTGVITDIITLKRSRLTNISQSLETGTSVKTLRNYFVYTSDVDRDGVLELPRLITMKPISVDYNIERQYLIQWYSMGLNGGETEKMYSFHNYAGGWFLKLDSAWAEYVTLDQMGNTYLFFLWDESFENVTPVFTVYALTGSDRETQAQEDNRFPLYRTDDVVYAARLDKAAAEYGITQDNLINSFRLIREEWKMGDM